MHVSTLLAPVLLSAAVKAWTVDSHNNETCNDDSKSTTGDETSCIGVADGYTFLKVENGGIGASLYSSPTCEPEAEHVSDIDDGDCVAYTSNIYIHLDDFS
ncbi:hypothetical protein F5Y15DRAFT_411634 [Xylariaceae sp. FL0016]|nr:hypothetical protein F5Y15DRAFT_411634 [Xylariaceae sp. FL0016]